MKGNVGKLPIKVNLVCRRVQLVTTLCIENEESFKLKQLKLSGKQNKLCASLTQLQTLLSHANK